MLSTDYADALVRVEKIIRELNMKIAGKRHAEARNDCLAARALLREVEEYCRKRAK